MQTNNERQLVTIPYGVMQLADSFSKEATIIYTRERADIQRMVKHGHMPMTNYTHFDARAIFEKMMPRVIATVRNGDVELLPWVDIDPGWHYMPGHIAASQIADAFEKGLRAQKAEVFITAHWPHATSMWVMVLARYREWYHSDINIQLSGEWDANTL